MAGGSALLGEAVSTFGEAVSRIREAISRLMGEAVSRIREALRQHVVLGLDASSNARVARLKPTRAASGAQNRNLTKFKN